jgi:DNA-binding CsgD family transcriptional regulator
MPHLVEAQRESRLGRPVGDAGAAPPLRSRALCDPAGTLLDMDAHCLALLRAEWPRWSAPALPALLRAALTGGWLRAQPFHGRQITVLMSRCGDGLLLEARRRGPVDRLSDRQRGIAELYAAGRTGSEIAAQLGLAESTVNNHLGAIFKKLEVSNKLQLATAVREGAAAAAR